MASEADCIRCLHSPPPSLSVLRERRASADTSIEMHLVRPVSSPGGTAIDGIDISQPGYRLST